MIFRNWSPILLRHVVSLAAAACAWFPPAGYSCPPPDEQPARLSPSLPAARPVLSTTFATSQVCRTCHSNAPGASAMRDAKDRPVSPYDLWRSSMMANSARDPYWRAVLSAEIAATPSRKAKIEDNCFRCHVPMAAVELEREDKRASPDELFSRDSDLAQLALDGVSCTTCHQITAQGLGTENSFVGRFVIGDEKRIFGPHRNPFSRPMYRQTGFLPTDGAHLQNSSLCATCHTLVTDTLAPDGSATGHKLFEQAPYLEWQNSVFNTEATPTHPSAASCQDCHVPTTDDDGMSIVTRIARNPGGFDFPPTRERFPFGRHIFVGGNTLIPTILRDHGMVLLPNASREAFDKTIDLTRGLLREKTARLELGRPIRSGDSLSVPLTVRNLTGHKLPTGYPSRRLWIRFRVRNSKGVVIFSSGDYDKKGRLVSAADRLLPFERQDGPIEPHRNRVTSQDQVQIYESVMADPAGNATFRLLRGATYKKDNRLLPQGWNPDHPMASTIAPEGTKDDSDFGGGSDTVLYDFYAPVTSGPFEIEAALLYQTIRARDAAELFRIDTPEVNRFRTFYEAADTRPDLVWTEQRRFE